MDNSEELVRKRLWMSVSLMRTPIAKSLDVIHESKTTMPLCFFIKTRVFKEIDNFAQRDGIISQYLFHKL